MRNFLLSAILIAMSMGGCAAACGTSIPPGTVGILVDKMAGGDSKDAMQIINGPDMVFVGPYHTLYDFPVSVQQYTWSANKHEGADHNEEFQFQTVDGSVVHADLGITFHIPPQNVVQVFKTYRKDLDSIRNVYIRNTIREALNEVTSQLNVNDAIGPKKDYIMTEVQKRTTERLGKDGIVIDSLSMVGAFRPPDAVINSLNAKLAATQLALQTQNEVAQAQAQALKDTAKATGEATAKIATARGNAESRRLEAEAEANANERIARSLTPALVEYKRIEKWNGQQPQIVTGNGGGGILLDVRQSQK
jgi:regulator of protease activity HflC (stomatin/prohibitin superfamily)